MNNEPTPDSSIDPYEPPLSGSTWQSNLNLGPDFWIPITIALAISCACLVTFFLIGFRSEFSAFAVVGFFGILSTGMAIARGLVWQRRLPQMDKSHQVVTGFKVFLTSIFVGLFATLISLLCCAIVCVPLGIAFLSARINPLGGGIEITVLSIICSCLGLFVGYLFVRSTVPKVPTP